MSGWRHNNGVLTLKKKILPKYKNNVELEPKKEFNQYNYLVISVKICWKI